MATLKQFLDRTGLEELASKITSWVKSNFLDKNSTSEKAKALDVADTGNSSKPVYFRDGKPVACAHTVESDVPPNASFESVTVDMAMSATSTNPVQNKTIKSYVDAKANTVLQEAKDYTNNNSNNTIVDTAMSATSTNPVQNKTIKSYVDTKANTVLQEAKDYTNNNSNNTIVDTAMSATSTNPVQNKAIKNYVDNLILNLEKEILIPNISKLNSLTFLYSNTNDLVERHSIPTYLVSLGENVYLWYIPPQVKHTDETVAPARVRVFAPDIVDGYDIECFHIVGTGVEQVGSFETNESLIFPEICQRYYVKNRHLFGAAEINSRVQVGHAVLTFTFFRDGIGYPDEEYPDFFFIPSILVLITKLD